MEIFEGIYEKMCKAMGELQPIAFFLSASIVISGIFVNNKDLLDNRICTLLAAGCFFFAYVYLLIFRLTNFDFLFVPGVTSLIAAFYFIIKAVNRLTFIAPDLNDILPAGQYLGQYFEQYLGQYFEQYLGQYFEQYLGQSFEQYLGQYSPISELTFYILIVSFIACVTAPIIFLIIYIILRIILVVIYAIYSKVVQRIR